MNKKDFVKKLKDKGLFWSYSKNASYTDNVVMEQTLRWGDVDDLILLFSLFDKEKIFDVWVKHLLPDERLYAHNYYLARIFFDIEDDVEEFIKYKALKNNRYERIKEFTS